MKTLQDAIQYAARGYLIRHQISLTETDVSSRYSLMHSFDVALCFAADPNYQILQAVRAFLLHQISDAEGLMPPHQWGFLKLTRTSKWQAYQLQLRRSWPRAA